MIMFSANSKLETREKRIFNKCRYKYTCKYLDSNVLMHNDFNEDSYVCTTGT